MPRNILIAFCGFKRSGKDSCAQSLKKQLNVDAFTIEPFAQHIKVIINEIFGIEETSIEDKEKPISFTKKYFGEEYSYRQLLIKIGDGIKELVNPNIWTMASENKLHKFAKIETSITGDRVFVIPDVRYRSELKLLKKMKRLGWEVYLYSVFRKTAIPEWAKMGLNPNVKWENSIIENDFASEYCEQEVLAANPKLNDVIYNDGTIDDLDKEVLNKIIKKIWK